MTGVGRGRHVRCARAALSSIIAWLALGGAADAQAAARPLLKRIKIESSWVGLGASSSTDLLIEPAGSGYRMTGRQVEPFEDKQWTIAQDVPAEKVQRLLAAMRAPARPQLDAAMFKPVSPHLQEEIDRLVVRERIPNVAPVQRKLAAWRNALRRDDALMRALARGLNAVHTDDLPLVRVEASMSDGSTLTALSTSQHFLMLPWKNGQDELSYASELPLSLAALLPERATNRGRMQKDGLADYDLDEVLLWGIYGDLNSLRAEAVAPDAYRVLSEHFAIVSMEAGAWRGPQLDAVLRLPYGLPNLSIHTRFAYKGVSLADARDMHEVRGQLRAVQASPAMSARVRAHPRDEYRIDTFGWTVLDKETVKQFFSQMQALDKLPELKTHPELMQGAVLVEESAGPSYWIVLSDGRAVLWKTLASGAKHAGGVRCDDLPFLDDPEQEPKPRDHSVCYGDVY